MDASSDAFQRQKLIRHENLLWLIVAQAVVIFPLLLRLPFWLWFVWFGTLLWRFYIYLGKLNYPSASIKLLLSCLCIAGLFISYQRSIGMEFMVAFLSCVFVLKLIELRTRKDGLLLLFISFIAIAMQFLFAQSFWTALYACFSCFVLISAWHTIYLTRQLSSPAILKSGVILLVHAIPLMLAMFVIMPRIGPLWRGPLPQTGGHSGFSDSLSPGDLSQLVLSKDLAFRVNFEGKKTPKREQMYWRGLILDQFDGRTWRLDEKRKTTPLTRSKKVSNENLLAYDILVEPHQYNWLFALAEPITISHDNLTISTQGVISTRSPLVSRLQYHVQSMTPSLYQWPILPVAQRRYLTKLPEGYNPKTIDMAKDWVSGGNAPVVVIEKALRLFQQSFYYTLQPPLLGKNSVDDFLFTSKRGFCEHFASSFVVLMRAAGVPARVVVGYQGGTYNELQNYWKVTQADAHAWAQIWLDGIGWQRVDPTRAVAPQRIEQGINNALPDSELSLVGEGQFNQPQWILHLQNRLDAANYLWNRWVLSYNADKQSQFLNKLFGGAEPWRIGLVFLCLSLFILVMYTLIVIRPKWRSQTPLQRALKKFDLTCKRWQLQRQNDQTIAVFVISLAKQHPELKNSCQRLAEISQRALYAEDKKCQRILIKALQQFPKDVI